MTLLLGRRGRMETPKIPQTLPGQHLLFIITTTRPCVTGGRSYWSRSLSMLVRYRANPNLDANLSHGCVNVSRVLDSIECRRESIKPTKRKTWWGSSQPLISRASGRAITCPISNPSSCLRQPHKDGCFSCTSCVKPQPEVFLPSKLFCFSFSSLTAAILRYGGQKAEAAAAFFLHESGCVNKGWVLPQDESILWLWSHVAWVTLTSCRKKKPAGGIMHNNHHSCYTGQNKLFHQYF